MILKNFQNKAINKLIENTKELLNSSTNSNIIFKSPTGSGKTIMVAEFIHRLIKDKISNKEICFIWAGPRRTLTEQSKEKLTRYLNKFKDLKCSSFSELENNEISENEILFLNWESINKKNKSTIIVENEREFFLTKVLEKTKDKRRDIFLIIDESHHHATSEISKKLIDEISPKIAIEVSATPVVSNPDAIINVKLDDVKLEGLIKKTVILNEKFDNLLSKNKITSSLSEGSDKFIIDEAIKKRELLLDKYKKNKSKVNPLVLIQLPDNIRGQQEDKVRIEIQQYLASKHKIKTENGKLAIRLSEDKKNLENIAKNENEVEVLIFKQAIALGWDCPRAQILALFRNWKTLSFSIQTVGRIMRMPEVKKGHYKDDILNHSYIYTNLSDISLKEDRAKDYLSIFSSFSNLNIKLLSYTRTRQRERTRLSPLFIKIFLKEAEKFKLAKKLNLTNKKAKLSFIINQTSDSIDNLTNKTVEGKKYEISNDKDLQALFDFFIRNNLSPFYAEDRSVGRLKESIYKFFKVYLKISYEKDFSKIINLVLNDDNIDKFVNLIDISKSKYIEETEAKEDHFKTNNEWSFPKALNFTGNYTELKTKKSVMKPFYYDYKWKTEENFIKYIDKSKDINFWFKNGDSDETYFALPYNFKKQINLFYIDFIIMHKNGKIGLFDTKSGSTIDAAKEKSDGLQNYISKNEKKFFGGIVTNTDPENFNGRWVYFDKPSKFLDSTNLKNWKTLEF